MSLSRPLLGLLLIALAACGQEKTVEASPPAEVTADATGYYCGMLLQDHAGPKGQIHLAGRKDPIWFSSVRDTVAFTRLPEEPKDIVAIYVNDMGRATDWAHPQPGTWVEARQAWFVIDSRRMSGMGAAEAVPFSDEGAATAFAATQGGKVVRFDGIPDSYVLSSGEVEATGREGGESSSHGSHATD